MGKINNWLIFIIIVLFFVNLFYWFNQVEPTIECVEGDVCLGGGYVFDPHNFGWGYAVLSLVVLELIFFALLFTKQKKIWESWWIYTFNLKGLAFLYMTLLWLVIFPLIWLFKKIIIGLIDNWDKVEKGLIWVLIIVGIAGLIGLWVLVNYLLTKKLGKEKKRLFKEGEKVRVRKDLVAWAGDFYPSMEKYRGKKVTIKKYSYNAVYIKEDRGKSMWREYMFEKIGRKNGRTKTDKRF